jgi:hypothetical protein
MDTLPAFGAAQSVHLPGAGWKNLGPASILANFRSGGCIELNAQLQPRVYTGPASFTFAPKDDLYR